MRILRFVLAMALVVFVAASVTAADPTKKAAKKGAAVRGQIVSVEKDADKNTATLTVKVVAGKKDPNAVAEEKKFKVTEATKIEKIMGKLKDGEAKAATLGDLAKNQRVMLTIKNDVVESIKFVEGKKK